MWRRLVAAARVAPRRLPPRGLSPRGLVLHDLASRGLSRLNRRGRALVVYRGLASRQRAPQRSPEPPRFYTQRDGGERLKVFGMIGGFSFCTTAGFLGSTLRHQYLFGDHLFFPDIWYKTLFAAALGAPIGFVIAQKHSDRIFERFGHVEDDDEYFGWAAVYCGALIVIPILVVTDLLVESIKAYVKLDHMRREEEGKEKDNEESSGDVANESSAIDDDTIDDDAIDGEAVGGVAAEM